MSGERSSEVWFEGDYGTWAEARAASTGYDAPAILERVIEATRKVVAGEAVYERDSVTFDRIEYSLPLLVCLLYAASRCGNRLDLVDFGGSLGSSYRQNRRLLRHLDSVRWSIVEQPHFVAAGRAEFETEELRFFPSIEDCAREASPRVVLLSGVLQCVERPYELLGEILGGSFDLVIVERTQFFVADLPQRITVEHVPASIYPARYPSWFLNLPEFRAFIGRSAFEILVELDSWEAWRLDGDETRNKCFLLERRS